MFEFDHLYTELTAGLSEEGVHEKEVVGSGGGNWEMVAPHPINNNQHDHQQRKKHRKQQHLQARNTVQNMMSLSAANRKFVGHNNNNNNSNIDDEMEEEEVDDDEDGGGGGVGGVTERQREHPFIVTEPGEVARGKKNGLDYLFHLYEQCREFLLQVQNIAKERGEKCPTKVLPNLLIYSLINQSFLEYIISFICSP